MKTAEEKVKAYDYALSKAKDWYNGGVNEGGRGILEDIFPELCESEDEKIRKAIVEYFLYHKSHSHTTTVGGVDIDNVIAYLEKQGESVEINPTEFDTRLQALIGKFDSLPKEELIGSLSFWMNVVQNDGTYKSDEKQGEQKPVEWSEKDKKELDRVIYMMEQLDLTASWDDSYNWLKSLKNRVFPQAKPVEWSEEDEAILTTLIHEIQANKKEARSIEHNNYDKLLDWLKSLRPQKHCITEDILREGITKYGITQYQIDNWLKPNIAVIPSRQWKPTKEQINAVKEAACYSSVFSEKTIDNLISLSKQLKSIIGYGEDDKGAL